MGAGGDEDIMATPIDPQSVGFLIAESRNTPIHVGGLLLLSGFALTVLAPALLPEIPAPPGEPSTRGIALLLIVFNMHPEWVLLVLATLFWLSGPLAYLYGLAFRRRPGPPPMVTASEAH